MRIFLSRLWLGAFLSSCMIQAAEMPAGEQVFNTFCAACHQGGDPEAPRLSALRTMNPHAIDKALVMGKMAAQGAALSGGQRAELVTWLTRGQSDYTGWEDRNNCSGDEGDIRPDHDWVSRWGVDEQNHRHQATTGISPANVANLEQAWVLAFPGAATMRSQPAVLGNTLYLAVADSYKLYAINRHSGCIYWTYTSESAPRSAVGAGKLESGRQVVYFGDINGHVHMVDAGTGELVWRRRLGVDPRTAFTAAPLLVDDVLYVAHSSLETLATLDTAYECCQIPGAISAHNAATGEQFWLARTVSEARPRGKSSVGTSLWGPAGASVWAAPVVDRDLGLIFIGTGPLAAPPDEGTSDAVIALDIKTGERRWVFQATAGDFWNGACRARYQGGAHPNCDFERGKDFDFGAGMVLATGREGQALLLAGQKSGGVFALDRASGRLVWQHDLGTGTPLGGIHWGMAVQEGSLYVPNNDPTFPENPGAPDEINQWLTKYQPAPGLYRIDIATGERRWAWRASRRCEPNWRSGDTWPECPRQVGLSGAVLSIPGLIISTGSDGVWRAHRVTDGEVVHEVDTARPFDKTRNGVPGHGGSMDNATLVAAGDMLYVQSGYGFFGGTPGNVLIAYRLPSDNTQED